MRFHVVTGLPRSGSTLLCNILNQRDDTFASSTSALPGALGGIADLMTKSPEETSRLANIPGTAEHHVRIGRALVEAWHETDAPVVFDKSRGWARLSLLLRQVAPESGIVVTVRDPREVLASIERRNAQTGMYEAGRSLFDACNQHVSENGLVGGPISWVEDLIRRKLPNVCFVDYDALCAAPDKVLAKVEATCQLEPFTYDFESVEPTATDLDPLYRNKFPHDGSGPVKRSDSDWREVITDDIAQGTLQRWPLFCRTFGYT